jgi:hypothetical protein
MHANEAARRLEVMFARALKVQVWTHMHSRFAVSIDAIRSWATRSRKRREHSSRLTLCPAGTSFFFIRRFWLYFTVF